MNVMLPLVQNMVAPLLHETPLHNITISLFKVRTQSLLNIPYSYFPAIFFSGLPEPDVSITISSTAGLGSEECLGLVLQTASDSVICEAGVIPNLYNLPRISLWRDETLLQSNSTLTLNYSLLPNELLVGEFHCRVCINVQESGIENHCSNNTVATSENS